MGNSMSTTDLSTSRLATSSPAVLHEGSPRGSDATSRLRFLASTLGMTVLCLAIVTETARAAQFTDLGVQISSSTLIGTTFDKGCVYSVMRGHPAKLLAIDLKSGELTQSLPLEGADGAWNACTAT